MNLKRRRVKNMESVQTPARGAGQVPDLSSAFFAPRSPARVLRRPSEHLFSVDEVRKGLPIRALDDLAGVLRVDPHDLASVLGTSVRTLQRKAGENDRLAPSASDRLARIRRILDLATHVFGEPEKASAWLTTASRPLGGEIPLHMLDTDLGTQRVEQELRQIEFGMPV